MVSRRFKAPIDSLSHNLHRNPSRALVAQFVANAASATKRGSRVLDAGAGDCRYRNAFSHCNYVAVDFAQVENKQYGRLNLIGDLTRLPFKDYTFDAVICTQVLAHIPEPKNALSEMFRVLKPEGVLYLTCPLSFEQNEAPYDFYRYTQYGLRYISESAGFEVESIEALGGYLATLQYQLGTAARNLPMKPSKYGSGIIGLLCSLSAFVLKPAFAFLCVLYTWALLNGGTEVNGMNTNWAMIARRPPALIDEKREPAPKNGYTCVGKK